MPHGFLGVSPEEYVRAGQIGRDVLGLSQNALLIHLRFLDQAITRLDAVIHNEISFATDGEHLYFEPFSLLRRYRQEQEAMTRDYLHVLLHCLLRHMYLHKQVERSIWDLACDVTVEALINSLDLTILKASRQSSQTTIIADLERKLKHLTAEKLYRYFLGENLKPGEIREIRKHFRADDHGLWYQENGFLPGGGRGEQDWADLSRHVQGDLQTFARSRGQESGSLLQNLSAVNREKYDYAAFLRKFASRQEEMKIDDDEFDYIFYTYGLKLYEKMPLVEPLEYKETKKVREFVIALDTSGSVSGKLVQGFVQKTYNILRATESFASKINLHIIQCDLEIREDVKVTSQEEFDAYLAHMTLKGFGGTDFRPVFAYVEELRKQKEFHNLKGLIYFTDGLGIYPERKPDYDTAFVFLDEDYLNPTVPPWAIKLILDRDEIERS